MNTQYINIVLSSLLILIPSFSTAQDIHFSNYETFFPSINPSMTGYIPDEEDLRTAIIYRNQWGSVLGDGSYKTYGVSFDMRNCLVTENRKHFSRKGRKLETPTWGFGLTILHDESGTVSVKDNASLERYPLDRNQLIGSASLHLPLSDRMFFNAGFRVGGILQRIRTDHLTYDEQFDGVAGFDPNITGEFSSLELLNNQMFDIGAGLSLAQLEKKWGVLLGGAVDHILVPPQFDFIERDDEFDLSRRYAAHLKIAAQLYNEKGKYFGINFRGIFLHQNTFQHIIGGFDLLYQDEASVLTIGPRFRSSRTLVGKHVDAILIAVTINFSNYSLGFNYDVNASKLTDVSGSYGALEFSMSYRWQKGSRKCNPPAFGCPDKDTVHAIFF